jgi:hypothetical protein
MASAQPIPDAYRMLKEMFDTLDENMVRKVYEDYKNHANPFDAAVSELLTLAAVAQDKEQKKNEEDEDVRVNAQGDAPPSAYKQLGVMFPDLTQSIIGGALFQNGGQTQGAIELLLNIGQDKDAIAQIRDMNPEKKAEYANDRAREREAQLAARAAQLEKERLENAKKAEAQRAAQAAEKAKQEQAEAAANRVRMELVELMEAKLAAEVATERAQAREREVESQLAEARRIGAERGDHIDKLEEQKERDAQLAREAQDELARRLKMAQERQGPNEPLRDLGQSIAHLKGEAARRVIENVRIHEENERAKARLAEVEQRARLQQEQLDQLNREKQALKSCSVSAEYSQKDKRLLVSWRLGEDKAPTSYDWIGVFSINSTNPKQYHTYISTEANIASTHECPLPTEPGLYVCCFFYGKSHEMIATSEQIYLGPSLEMRASSDLARRIITLHYQVKTGNATKKDWIGFYRSDKPDRTYIEYKWLAPDCLEGMWEVKMPRRGGYDYEFRFFSHTIRVPLQVSNKVSLPKEDYLNIKETDVLELGTEVRHQVSWTVVSVDPSNWDWIELVSVPQNTRITWNYIDTSAPFASFNVPRTPGTYQYRYWAKSIGSGPTALSPTFDVINRDKLSLAVVDGLLQVTYDIYSVVNNNSCWIGIYPEGSDKYTTFNYISTTAKSITFSVPSGRYEARFFSSSDKYNPVIRSDVIQF